MKKVIKTLLLFMLCVNFVFAKDWFLGAEGSLSSNNTLHLPASEDLKSKSMAFDIKIGQYYDKYRWYMQFGSTNEVQDRYIKWSFKQLLIDIDWTPRILQNFNFMLGFYTGLAFPSIQLANGDDVIYSRGTYSHSYSINISKDIIAMPLFGIRAGGIYTFDKHNAIEFGIKGDVALKLLQGQGGESLGEVSNSKMSFFVGYVYKF